MITYGITVCDELFEFKRLIDSLTPYLIKGEEIVVLADALKITQEIKSFCESRNLPINYYNFNNDFANFKNELISLAKTKYLFQIDADEQIPPSLLLVVRQLLAENNYDCLWIPRINIVHGYTEQDVINFNWQINKNNWIQFPDYQLRVFQINDKIKWHKGVHEQVIGYEREFALNFDPVELFSILHVKEIAKQIKQNNLYKEIENNA